MGTFHTKCAVTHIAQRKQTAELSRVLLDTASEFTWIPTDVLEKIGVECEKKDQTITMANGQHVSRSVGFAVVHVGAAFTVDEIVFGG